MLLSIIIHWILSIFARLLCNFAMLTGVDENISSFCLLLQQLPLLSYTFSQLVWKKAKKKSFLQSLTLQLFWLLQLNLTDFSFENASESCVWQKRAQPFWDMWDPLLFSHKFTSCGCSSSQTCLLQLAEIPSALAYIIPEKVVLLAD